MKLRSKTSFLLKIALCVALALSTFGAVLGFVGNNKLTAQADTVKMDDKISIGTWGEAETGITWMHVGFNGFSVAGADWHIADSKIDANNGVDPLQYVLINGKTAREHYVGDNSSLTVMTATGWTEAFVVKVSKTYLDLGEFTFQLKAGFTLVGTDGNVYVLQNDTALYGWDNGNFKNFPTSSMDGNISIGTWGEAETGITWMHVALSNFTVAGKDWHTADASVITANAWSDPLLYTYINGRSAREIYNEDNSALTVITATSWTEAYVVKVAKTYLDLGEFTIQLKAGFTLVGADGTAYVLQNDTAVYGWTEGNFGEYVAPEEPQGPENIEYSEYIGLEDRSSWASGGNAEVVTLGVMDYSITEGSQYLTTFTPVGENATCWYRGNTTAIEQNNGVDIMQYIYVNGESARDALNGNTENNTGSYGWLTNAAAWPIAVETVGDFWIRLDNTYFGETFTLTFKAGFSIIKADGAVAYLENDVEFAYSNGTITKTIVTEQPEVPADAIDIVDTLTMEDRAWGAHEGENYVALLNNGSYFNTSVNGAWYVGNDEIISANGGLDIMKYILLNGDVARDLITANANGDRLGNSCSCWLSNPAAYPIYVESSAGSGLMIRIAKAYAGTEFVLTFKAGFTITDVNGDVVTLSRDVAFSYANGTITKSKIYTLSFESNEGDVDSIDVKGGLAIGELPAVPEKDGFAGFWTIDGVQINSETLYNYGDDKTAVAEYVQKIFTLTFENVSSKQVEIGTAIGTLPAVPEMSGYVGFAWAIDGAIITEESIYNYAMDKTATPMYALEYKDLLGLEDRAWGAHTGEYYFGVVTLDPFGYFNSADAVCGTWYVGNEDPITANNGVDIMQYIYINDTSARDLIVANKNGDKLVNSCSCWLSNPAASPVYVETTNDSGIIIRVLESFVGESFTITFKAGFSLIRNDGEIIYLSKDVIYKYVNGTLTKVQEYTLSFEGLDETLTVVGGEAIGVLPNVPENGDLEGVWIIDGVEINENTVYTYSENKTAIASYSLDITKTLALEDRTSWGAHDGEYYFGVLDKREENKVVNDDSTTYYLNSIVEGCWYVGNDNVITANGGVDILQYIYVNETSVRDLITANANGDRLSNSCGCWLSNPAAYPVYVEPTNGSGLMIRIAEAYVGNYFEITFKKGFSLINEDGNRVYLSKDVTYKYIVADQTTTLAKGELTDDDLDSLNGQVITLLVDGQEYFVKKTVRLTLPQLDNVVVDDGLSQVFVGWTTDINNISSSNLYPAGYRLENLDSAMTLHAVRIGFEMEDGAAVRLAAGSSGIRFITHIDQTAYNNGVSLNLILEVGTILCPTSYLVNGGELTHLMGAGYFVAGSADVQKFTSENGVNTYATAFVGISEKDYSRQYSARGYIKIQFATGEGYVYTNYDEEHNSRSIYEVATSAYNDENVDYKQNATILNYINKVLDITWTDYNFSANNEACGNSTVSDISVSGNTVTVTYEGDISSVVVNGYRLVANGNVNVPIGNLLYNFNNVSISDGVVEFTLGAATNTYDKQSDETLFFKSNDSDLDFFLNDFFKRHTGVVENGERLNVNSTVAGAGAEEFFNQEWLSMSYYWYNASEGFTSENGENEDRIAGLNARLTDVPVDDYGYVWSSNDRVRDPYSEISSGEQRMGWPFPNNDTVSTSHWEFNGEDSGSWSSNVSASVSGGLYQANLSGQSSNVTFTSNSFASYSSKKIYTKYAPLLEFEVRIADVTNVDDIVVWYTTNSSTSFSDDKKLSVKEYAFLSYDIANATGAYDHILYLPMYAQTAWGESTSVYVKQLKIEIVLKSGTTLSGAIALNYVRPTLDTRMSNNNSIYISSLRTAYDYTGDIDFLVENITKARKAYNFLMQMYDSSRGLKKESYLVGHGGDKEDLNWFNKATADSISNSISQGYWDIMYMPEYDFQSNVYFQKALADMVYLEQVLVDNGKTVTKSLANVKTATRGGGYATCTYTQYGINANKIKTYASTNLTAIQANLENGGFWNESTGRFAAGKDSEGNVYDYGYVAWNLEAIYYGIATNSQATSIMNWLATEGNLYDFVFAPRSITVSGLDVLNGEYEAKKWDFGENCQYGGAILYTSFYDIMARLDVNGADDAFARLTAIQEWYQEVYDYYVANGTDPYDFYRYYYDNQGIQMQGMGTAGAVGIDREFLESALPIASVAYGFFGIDSVDGKTLSISPELPTELCKWGMENLLFNDVKYDLTIYGNAIQLSNLSGDVTGLSLTIALDYTEGQSVYVNGVKVTDFTVENGKAIVTVEFGATVVEVR